MRRRTRLVLAFAALGASLLAACASPAYYWQAAGGQLEILRLARPIDAVRADPTVPLKVRDKLAQARSIREFASQELKLPDNDSYRKYADLKRPYVVWNVFATGEFSIRPREWCFMVAGCVSYRGYFAQADAQAFAAELRRQGNDVYVGGVPAYSTLGWLDDPLLSTFILYPDAELARLIFHELAHQVAYARDDTQFNESFAMTVELEGVRRWLAQYGDAAERSAFDAAQQRRDDFAQLVLTYRDALGALFDSPADGDAKRRGKAQIIAALHAEYRQLRDGRWGGYAGYDRWFGQDINNATLASIGLYQQRVPQFRALLAAEDNHLPRFYARVKQLAHLPKAERDAALDRLAPAAPAVAAR